MKNEKYTRECPKCKKSLVYGSSSAYLLATKKNALCRNCSSNERAASIRKCDMSPLLEETPEAYYWIGFLLSDGHFSNGRVVFHLKLIDSEHVIKFAKFINWTGTFIDRKELGIRVEPKHTEVVNELINKFDIKQAKTYNPPKTLLIHDAELLKCLVIGFIDGDGNITRQTRGRKDFMIRIKLHSSWFNILKEICQIIKYDDSHVIINKQGYAQV